MYRIQLLNQISRKGTDRFARERYELGGQVEAPDAILLRSHKLAVSELGANLKAVARAGAGVNNIPVSVLSERGIPVFNTPGANANAVKELVLCAMLLASRGIVPGLRYVETLAGMTDVAALNATLEQEKKRFAGQELAGRTLGVVGLGAIGSRLTDAALHLGMTVLGYDPALSVEAAWRVPNQVQKMDNLASLLARSDYVSLHVPLLENTRNLLREETLAYCKKGAVLLNFAREGVVDESAVVKFLDSGYLRQYVADFPHPLLMGRSDVLLLPHLGASTLEAEENCAVMAADQLIDYLETGNIRNSVNFPTLVLERNGGCRLAFSNRNVPKILGKVLSLLADHNLNVLDMLNKSRDEIAYNLIDVECEIPPALLPAIRAVEGVIDLRVIPG
ncbi:MAG: phosphoglycerate dehydrogenase [Pseudomonadales bacterium]|jgi:D-3-phosphoglycerate dehydrogenase|nr:phosphoglycerate dehydrogenase [Pseudomonadales bacterium]MCP5332435.1 phosphoglycerate dehydrogenase [Pseudomonadales bacterium]HMU90638.1 phosphoglycerate dehydrogenase [Pseudomonadales bacterium]HMW15485.1 phosphoglycerate dehydrogenase [Pseudomonadales bacterium]HMW83701.1 phosphoglycerate dehydrogenase [Pseudomonadales bacterium]